ncbi:MAG: ABC transporter substrate-binding protein [Chthonomonadales bacterium]|nr:ABC transporter substrate-binding protein [Chthonomonadales bacterium]
MTTLRLLRPGPSAWVRLLLSLLASAAVLFPAGCRRADADRDAQGRTIVSVWHPWGGTSTPRIERVLAAYRRAHPDIALRVLFTPNDLSNNQKFFTSVAAGRPPDVIFVDGPQVAEWAERGALQPLDSYLKEAGVRATDYFAPCWKQNHYAGKTWALTFCADPNFAFVWNKDDFQSAGLDPEKGPTTIAELDRMADRLTRVEEGKITRIGLIPWAQYGGTNSLFTWGWAFGGSFYDEQRHRVTANDPRIVRALEWMVGYAKRYDVTRVTGLQQGFGTAQLDPFYVGQMSMRCLHISGIEDIQRYAPKLRYGITFLPAPPDGEARSSWVGGWCVALPAGARHPREGRELVRWLCADPEGTGVVGREMGLMPGYRRSPAFDTLKRLPGFGQFYRILLETRHQRPVMPVQGFYMGALQRAVDAAIYGKKTPKKALDDATAETQAELDVVLRGSG